MHTIQTGHPTLFISYIELKENPIFKRKEIHLTALLTYQNSQDCLGPDNIRTVKVHQ